MNSKRSNDKLEYLFLIDTLTLSPGATAQCALMIADTLAIQGNAVSILTLGYSDRNYCLNSNVKVFEVKSLLYTVYYGANSNKTSAKNRIAYFVNTFIKYCFFALHRNYFNAFLSKRILRRAKDIIKGSNKKPVVVSFSEPFSTILFGARLKQEIKNGIFWVAYEMDPFALNYTRPIEDREQNEAIERDALRLADLIVFADGIKEENDKQDYLTEYEDKSISLSLPNLKLPPAINDTTHTKSECLKSKGSPIILIYTGMFYHEFREPKPLINILSNANFDYELHLYGSIDRSLFSDYPVVYKHCVFHGRLDKKTCDRACANADILLDVQNDIRNQIPSKLLTYMSLGKPIVSFYSPGAEIGKEYLNEYPLALTIRKDKTTDHTTSDLFNSFCTTKHEIIDRSILNEVLAPYLHENIVKQLEHAIAQHRSL